MTKITTLEQKVRALVQFSQQFKHLNLERFKSALSFVEYNGFITTSLDINPQKIYLSSFKYETDDKGDRIWENGHYKLLISDETLFERARAAFCQKNPSEAYEYGCCHADAVLKDQAEALLLQSAHLEVAWWATDCGKRDIPFAEKIIDVYIQIDPFKVYDLPNFIWSDNRLRESVLPKIRDAMVSKDVLRAYEFGVCGPHKQYSSSFHDPVLVYACVPQLLAMGEVEKAHHGYVRSMEELKLSFDSSQKELYKDIWEHFVTTNPVKAYEEVNSISGRNGRFLQQLSAGDRYHVCAHLVKQLLAVDGEKALAFANQVAHSSLIQQASQSYAASLGLEASLVELLLPKKT